MTPVLRLTFLVIGIVFFKEISCVAIQKPNNQGSLPPIAPELPALPDLPGRPDLPSLPALPGRPDLPSLPALPDRPDLPWLPVLPTLPDLPENPNLSSLPALPTTPGYPNTLPDLPTLPTWPSRATFLSTKTLSPLKKSTTTKPSVIITSASRNSRPESITTHDTKTLSPNKPKPSKPCCSGITAIPTSKTFEKTNTTETTLSTVISGVSTSSPGKVSSETLTPVTPESSTRLYPEKQTPGISITSFPDTVITEIPISVTSDAETEIPETSVTSFPATEEPETSWPSSLTTRESETSYLSSKSASTLSSTELPETVAPETSVSSSVTGVPDISTSTFLTIETSETSIRVTVTPEDDTTTNVVDPSKLETDTPEISATSFSTTKVPDTSTRITGTSEDGGTAIVGDPSKFCPENQSLISERDLETIVKYKIDNLSLSELLNESYYAETVTIKDNIKDELQQFLIWFQDRPAHLKHILESLAAIRRKLDKNVWQQSGKLQKYTVLENEYNAKNERLRKSSKKIENYKNVCKLNCDDDSITFATSALRSNQRTFPLDDSVPWKKINDTKENQPDDSNIVVSIILDRPEEGGLMEIPSQYTKGGKYYCINIDALVHRIERILLHNLNTTKEDLKHQIIRDSKMYREKVEVLKKTLKSLALAQFGSSMYDILNLQDQYHHFDELLKTDVDYYIIEIKKQFALFESMIMDLEVRAEKLRKYCFACNMPLRRSALVGNSAAKDHSSKTDLVDYVTNKMYNIISEQAFADYHNIFNEIELIFEEWKSSDDKIANLKPIQEEIAIMTAQEAEELNKLKEAFPKKSIASVVELDRKAKELNADITAVERDLKDKYNI